MGLAGKVLKYSRRLHRLASSVIDYTSIHSKVSITIMNQTATAEQAQTENQLSPIRAVSDATGYVAANVAGVFAKKKAKEIDKANQSLVNGTALYVLLMVDFAGSFDPSDFIGKKKGAGMPINGKRATEFGALCIDPKKAHDSDGNPVGRGPSWSRHLWNTALATGFLEVQEQPGKPGVYSIHCDRKALKARLTDGDPIKVITPKTDDPNGTPLDQVAVRVGVEFGRKPIETKTQLIDYIAKLSQKVERYNSHVGIEIDRLRSHLTV